RPGWGGGRVRATAIELEALQRGESEELVEALLDGGELTEQARQALLDKTEGNPLFVEETMRMVAEEGAGSVERIPDTVQALIAARIDRLPGESKSLLQRAAVIGRVFWLSALKRLSPELESIEEPLDDLLLRDFVLDEPRSTIRGEQAYKFKHVLIREVAYASVSKSARAGHHQAFAGWLKERAGEAGDRWTQGRALVTLAEAVVLREADVRAAEEMIEEALRVFEPDDLHGRFRALRARATIAWTRGDLAKEEQVMREALVLAREAGRKDFESEAADELASVYLARLEFARATPLIEQAILLAE